MSDEQKEYFARRCHEPEFIARQFRFSGMSASVYQHHFVIVGPQIENPFSLLFRGGFKVYEAAFYEDCLIALLDGENYTVPLIP
jgi:hypothetical protein